MAVVHCNIERTQFLFLEKILLMKSGIVRNMEYTGWLKVTSYLLIFHYLEAQKDN